MADHSRSQENSESRKRHSNGKASESQESHTKPAASSAKRGQRWNQWEGKNPVLVMREACKKAGITFVEDPNHPMFTRGSSITFMGPNHHGSTSPPAKKNKLHDASSTNDACTEEKRDE